MYSQYTPKIRADAAAPWPQTMFSCEQATRITHTSRLSLPHNGTPREILCDCFFFFRTISDGRDHEGDISPLFADSALRNARNVNATRTAVGVEWVGLDDSMKAPHFPIPYHRIQSRFHHEARYIERHPRSSRCRPIIWCVRSSKFT